MNLKMLGLAAITAGALMAFVGASTASATELCSTNTTPCSGTMYGAGTKIEMRLKGGTKWFLVAAFATVECSESTIKGETSSTGGASETVKGAITTLSFGTCNCTVTVLQNGEFEIHTEQASSNGNGTLTLKNTRITITCAGVSCIFGAAAAGTDLGLLGGGNPALLVTVREVPWIAGDSGAGVCTLFTGLGTWESVYEVTAPKPLFVI